MAPRGSQSGAPATALILVDVIESFFAPGMPNNYPEASEVLEPLRRLLASARAAGRIVVHAVERHHPGFDDYEWRKLPRHHGIGDPDAAFVDGFSPSGPREIVCAKRRYSAFFATDLALFLREQAIDRVVIAGVKTNVCIRATAQDAFAYGFDVIVPREATNSNRPHLAAASLEDIERYFGAVVPLDLALEMMRS
jgi:maleamate amidohydrolase